MLKRLSLFVCFITIFPSTPIFSACPLKDGDIIFTQSQSYQAELLKIASGSQWSHVGIAFKRPLRGWMVIEAVQPVKWSTLYNFVKGSRNLAFKVRRPLFDFDTKKLRKYAESKLDLDYDLIFAWDDQRWYCTELVWKAYKDTANVEVGEIQKLKDLNIYDEKIIAEAKRRFEDYGLVFDFDLWKESEIITPVSMLHAPSLDDSLDVLTLDDFRGCVN